MKKKYATWMILLVVSLANVCVTYSLIMLGLSFVNPSSFSMPSGALYTSMLVILSIMWIVSFKLIPQVSPSDAIAKLRGLKTRNTTMVLWHLFLIGMLFWPLLAVTLFKGIKYKKHKVVSIKFDTNKWYTITLRPENFEEDEDGSNISVDDFRRCFAVIKDGKKKECLIKDNESLSYLRLKYSEEEILRTFGFLGGYKKKDSLLSALGLSRCPLKEKTSDVLGLDINLVKDSDVIDYIHYI